MSTRYGAWAFLCAASLGAGCATAPVPDVVLTTDIGVETDDQWALVHLALLSEAKQIRLLGVVTTHAPSLEAPAADSSARVAREVLSLMLLEAPPRVVAGSSTPLPASETPPLGPGGSFIVEAARGHDASNPLRVLSIGAATDVAEALLADPTLEGRIEVVAMGFLSPQGEDPWNVKNDPRAFDVIFRSSVPLVIGAADACVRHLTLDRSSARPITSSGGEVGAYLQRSLEAWIAREPDLCRQYTGREAWPIWDLVTVAHLLALTRERAMPRPTMREDLTLDSTGGKRAVRWITSIDQERLWEDLRARLLRMASSGSQYSRT